MNVSKIHTPELNQVIDATRESHIHQVTFYVEKSYFLPGSFYGSVLFFEVMGIHRSGI